MTSAVIDTMIFAYALFNEPQYRDQSLAVLASTDKIHTPDSLRAELCNVAWQWISHNQLDLNKAQSHLDTAESLIYSETRATQLWRQALVMAVYSQHPAYDTLFVVLAEQLQLPLVTYDKKLLNKFPAIVLSPEKYLESL